MKFRNISTKQESTCGVKDVTVLPFGNSILLRGIWTGAFMEDTMTGKEGRHGLIKIFSSLSV